ncbi:MAG: DUF2075 domain-containing protein [Candidatus Marinimicrobia bacterium]|jgi:hypothetical protein|nr:DUF2075 domain-containing protein [Bacteroidota bacterium]MBT3936276.1 DUF2075 domain-containing protein [Candidatus Neomarinimicrobiota bacterium]MBT4663204.1 DUF2075 domain-containing protein [Candidatus Neomarinimicrobiota bacterium]MBT4685470.1 DUF2075 domain-containing protein [Candidatus Neomarinimicrobiota bacterium]MBT5995448.1 DUF2075 domain-containing protein [Candidatus Neomarinimicrobiota bacterium]
MSRAYYSASLEKYLNDSSDSILGELTRQHQFALEDLQRNAWISQIKILKNELTNLPGSYLAFEYAIPRMGKRVDVIILYLGVVFVLEFKVGGKSYPNSALEQGLDYSVDLKNFHEQSHYRAIVPIIIATEAPSCEPLIKKYPDCVYFPIRSNENNFVSHIKAVANEINESNVLVPLEWLESIYKPTPTIIEAAQALYKGHSVKEISRSDSGTINLGATSDTISEIINLSKLEHKKSICFITGVPGAGKTLAGLNIANERHNVDEGEHAVFLSGNGPLVEVLQEALARNEVLEKKGTDKKITKIQALTKTKAFIQNIHHFRDDALQNEKPPIERVAVFDEAQRAWTLEQTRSFMARKKGIQGFDKSEPEFLISVLDRHQDWAIVICLIGGGQEINTGEAGLPEWFSAIQKNFPHWDVYVSNKLTDQEYTNGENIYSSLTDKQLTVKNELHLSVSVRSYRSEKLASFVKAFLDIKPDEAHSIYQQLKNDYPIAVTRDIDTAKHWLNSKARGGEGLGLTASSGAYRLKPYGIHIKSAIEPKTWFLNSRSDVRSAGFLEDVATEFDIQGLELDWTCIAWDANLRKIDNGWEFKNFRGTEWQNINDVIRRRYLLNAYRVLLTRARQGMIIFIPDGDESDRTRKPEFYNPVYEYFIQCGVQCI